MLDNLTVIDENEKLIANILHDIKSPLYSIKIGLQNHLENELNKDIFETAVSTLDYIEKFLVDYSFKQGKFKNKIEHCDIKKIIQEKIENYKYVFINKNICIDIFCNNNCTVNSFYIFLSSIIGNLISNIAFHAQNNTGASIEILKKQNSVFIEFKNLYKEESSKTSLGLGFCQNLAERCKIETKFAKTKNEIRVNLKIPNISY